VAALRPDAAWVLLRGLTRESGHWGDFPDRLRERFPVNDVITLDLPGNGEWHQLPSPTRIDMMSAWCEVLLRERGVAPPYALLAMSMGAMVAVDWTRRDPDAIAGCVLINTSLRPFSPWYHRLRPANHAALLRLALLVRDGVERERTILRLTSARPDDHAAVLDAWVRLRRARPVSRVNALRQLWAAARYRAPIQPPPTPTLVLASARDALVDVRCSQQLARRWQSEIALHPDAGHDLPLDDGAWVIEQVAQWSQQRLTCTTSLADGRAVRRPAAHPDGRG
jgi:pimeloyl-ACP methyl ester carboxylesterase